MCAAALLISTPAKAARLAEFFSNFRGLIVAAAEGRTWLTTLDSLGSPCFSDDAKRVAETFGVAIPCVADLGQLARAYDPTLVHADYDGVIGLGFLLSRFQGMRLPVLNALKVGDVKSRYQPFRAGTRADYVQMACSISGPGSSSRKAS